jgi:hypothetical protein
VLVAGEVPVEAKSAGSDLVDKLQGRGLPLEFGDKFADGVDAVHDLTVVADLAIKAIGGNGYIDGFLVNIHSDKECARFRHVDLLSRA